VLPSLTPSLPPTFVLKDVSGSKNRVWERASAELAGRAGIAFGDTLVFARAGVGLDELSFTNNHVREITTCVQLRQLTILSQFFSSVNFSTVDSITGCSRVSTRIEQVASQKAVIQPFVSFGAGVERNLGAFFVRLEGALLAHLPTTNRGDSFRFSTPVYYSTEVAGTVGVRF
jgi:hypothetical protein